MPSADGSLSRGAKNHLAPPAERKLLLFGADGPFGREMRHFALKAGHPIAAVSWRQAETLASDDPPLPLVNPCRPETYAAYLEGCDAVIDCMGLAAWMHRRDPGRHGRHVTEQVRRLLRAASTAGVRRVVLLGDVSWFAGQDPDADVTEDQPVTRRGFGRSLAPVWDALRGACREAGNAVRAHTGKIYGWGSWFLHQVVNPLKYEGQAHLIGKGANWISPIHSRDLAGGLLLAAEKGEVDRDYFLATEPIRMEEFLRLAAHYMGIQAAPRSQALWRAWMRLGRMAAEQEIVSCRASSTRARSELGWIQCYPAVRDGLPPALKDQGVLAWK